MTRPVLVSGGAGYVGGFAVRALLAAGERVVVLDDLSAGHRETVPAGVPLVVADLRDAPAVRRALDGIEFGAAMHFAASAYVGESVRDPRKYWENNVGGALNLLGLCLDRRVEGLVFSSTCAVYGEPPVESLREDLPRAPVNPYGRTKMVIEQALEDYSAAHGLRSFRLRYFNASGASEAGDLGEDHEPETHLIPLVLRAVTSGTPLRVFGTDWPTPDGTPIRDYVHLDDLARAHAIAIEAIEPGRFEAFNVGTGTGHSVREIVAIAERITGRKIPTVEGTRRPGDPARLVARNEAARERLGFTPERTIDDIVRSAWRWHESHPRGYGGKGT